MALFDSKFFAKMIEDVNFDKFILKELLEQIQVCGKYPDYIKYLDDQQTKTFA